MKIKKFDEKTLSETFLGSILLTLYRFDRLNQWQAVKYYNKLSKKIGDAGPTNLGDIFNDLKMEPPKGFCIVCDMSGKYSPVATAIFEDGEKRVLAPLIYDEGYTGILEHLGEGNIKVISLND